MKNNQLYLYICIYVSMTYCQYLIKVGRKKKKKSTFKALAYAS